MLMMITPLSRENFGRWYILLTFADADRARVELECVTVIGRSLVSKVALGEICSALKTKSTANIMWSNVTVLALRSNKTGCMPGATQLRPCIRHTFNQELYA